MVSKKKERGKQIAAIIGIVLLVCMYLLSLIFAICSFPGADRLFMASLFATVIVPILIWVYIWIYGIATHRKTIASTFPDDPATSESTGDIPAAESFTTAGSASKADSES